VEGIMATVRPEVTGRAIPLDPNFNREAWLDEVVTLTEGAYLRKVSVDTLKRLGKRGHIKILELSTKRRGITRREALKAANTASDFIEME
jgi:hypothetical protein